jgi:hypothetical protein
MSAKLRVSLLKEECISIMTEKRVSGRKFGPVREEVTEEWRNLGARGNKPYNF